VVTRKVGEIIPIGIFGGISKRIEYYLLNAKIIKRMVERPLILAAWIQSERFNEDLE